MSRASVSLAVFSACFTLCNIASGQLLKDGNMNALAIGTPPNCDLAAGAWEFPASYVTAVLCELNPPELQVVATSSFQAGATGNSMAMDINLLDPNSNIHMTNLLTSVVNEAPGQLVTANFDIWVPNGNHGGGSIYIGGDHGGGGYSNLSDRGPQIGWFPDGTLRATLGNGTHQQLVASYPRDAWQHIRFVIDLTGDTYDVFHGVPGGPITLVGDNVEFRSIVLDHLDRFTYANFGLIMSVSRSYLDNATVEVCTTDINKDGSVCQSDLGALLASFGTCEGQPGYNPAANVSPNVPGPQCIDQSDLGLLLSEYGCGGCF